MAEGSQAKENERTIKNNNSGIGMRRFLLFIHLLKSSFAMKIKWKLFYNAEAKNYMGNINIIKMRWREAQEHIQTIKYLSDLKKRWEELDPQKNLEREMLKQGLRWDENNWIRN